MIEVGGNDVALLCGWVKVYSSARSLTTNNAGSFAALWSLLHHLSNLGPPHVDTSTINLLDLPLEIRTLVYRLVFADCTLQIEQPISDYRVSSMLDVCHRIRQEAAPIFYDSVTFEITDEDLILRSSDRRNNIPPQLRRRWIAQIRKITISYELLPDIFPESATALTIFSPQEIMLATLVRYMPSLKEVEITHDLCLDWDDILLASADEHGDGTPTTLSEEEIELVVSLNNAMLDEAIRLTRRNQVLGVEVRLSIGLWWDGISDNNQLVCTFVPS